MFHSGYVGSKNLASKEGKAVNASLAFKNINKSMGLGWHLLEHVILLC